MPVQHVPQALPNLISGQPCLDFANTVEPRGGPMAAPNRHHQRDYLATYPDLVAWAIHTHLLEPGIAQCLLHAAQQHPSAAQRDLARAVELREGIYRVFYTIAHKQTPYPSELEFLAHAHRASLARATIVPVSGRYEWGWITDDVSLDAMLFPIVQSATALLTTGDLERIKICPGAPGDAVPCAWLFYDHSKNRTRRWCSMDDCGATAKTRRQNTRRRSIRNERPA